MRRLLLKLLAAVLLVGGLAVTDVEPASAGHNGYGEYYITVGSVHEPSCFGNVPARGAWGNSARDDLQDRHWVGAFFEKNNCHSAIGAKACLYDDWTGYVCSDNFTDFGQGYYVDATSYGHCSWYNGGWCAFSGSAIGGANYLSTEFRAEYTGWWSGRNYCEKWSHDPWSGWRWLGWWNSGDISCPWAFAWTSEPPMKQEWPPWH